MPLPLPVRVAALAAAGLCCAGCGTSAQPAATRANPTASRPTDDIPRTLPVHAGAKPLIDIAVAEASASGVAAAARIRDLAVENAAGGGTIRQPGAMVTQPANVPREERAPLAEPVIASAAPRGGQFIPPAAEFPTAGPLPQLPAVPNFGASPVPPPARAIVVSPPQRTNLPPVAAMPPAMPARSAQNFPAPAAARPDVPPAVAQQAQAIADRGMAMAQRGMLFAGRAELIKALQLVAQSLDVQAGNSAHAAALAGGLTALEEARDFSPADADPAAVVDVATVARTHRTPLLKAAGGAGLAPVAAQQQYFGLAQAQLAYAAGGQPTASQVLFRLGKLQTALAAHDAAPQALHGPQAMVYHQAALAADGSNFQAANELGVLLARYGQLQEAKLLLVRSVRIRPQVETWHNLAVVHRRLGEVELARQADRERELLGQKSGGRTNAAASDAVRLVDARTFAAAAGGEAGWPASTAVRPTAVNQQRR